MVWLRSLVFGHGQLYVAASRNGNPDNLKFAIKEQQGELFRYTANVVYNEVLLQQDVDEPPVPRPPAGPKGPPSHLQEREGGQDVNEELEDDEENENITKNVEEYEQGQYKDEACTLAIVEYEQDQVCTQALEEYEPDQLCT